MPAIPTLLFIVALYMTSQGLYSGCLKKIQQDFILNTGHSFFYCAVGAAFQALFILLLPPYGPLNFNMDALTLGAVFTVFNLLGVLLLFKALSLGPMGLTNVIIIVRNFLPIVVGLIFWNESVGLYQGLGLIVFVASLGMINLTSRQGGDRKPTLKWMLVALSSGLITGVAICVSKLYGFAQPTAFKEYLIAFNVIITLVLTPYLAVIWRKKELGKLARSGRFWFFSILSALGLAVANLLFMNYINAFSSALYFPMLSILAVLTTVLIGRIFFRERLNWQGLVGVGLSLAAIVLLNL
jgi:drug/metabolite transporter (DMT)-like permease